MASFPHHHPNRGVHRLCSGIFGFTHAFAVWQADPICARDRRDGKEDKLGTWRKPRECPVTSFLCVIEKDVTNLKIWSLNVVDIHEFID